AILPSITSFVASCFGEVELKLSVTMLAATSLAGRRLVVVMPVVHERAEVLQAFQTMAQMLLFGIRQEHIEFRDNLAHSLYRDMRILRICHANRQKALRLRRRPSPPSYGALQSLPGEWLAYSISYFHARRAIPESHDSSLRRIISRCHAIVVKKKVEKVKGAWWKEGEPSFTWLIKDRTILMEYDMKEHAYRLDCNVLIIDFEDPTLGVQRKRILRLTDDELEFKDEEYGFTEVLRKMNNVR